MTNFLITDQSSITPETYFKYIIQFDNNIDSEIWFLENEYDTFRRPMKKETLECIPFNEQNAKNILTFAQNNKIEKFILIESSENYRVLCFTEQERNEFTAERVKLSSYEALEFTEVEPTFVYGFCNTNNGENNEK